MGSTAATNATIRSRSAWFRRSESKSIRPSSSTCRLRTFVQAASHSPMLDAAVAVWKERAWRSARADPEPCKPLREVRLTFFPFVDDVTNDGREGCSDGTIPMASVTLNIVGLSWYDQSKIFLARSGRTAGRVKHIHVTYGRPVVGAGKETQKATLWQAPNNSIMARLSTGQ